MELFINDFNSRFDEKTFTLVQSDSLAWNNNSARVCSEKKVF